MSLGTIDNLSLNIDGAYRVARASANASMQDPQESSNDAMSTSVDMGYDPEAEAWSESGSEQSEEEGVAFEEEQGGQRSIEHGTDQEDTSDDEILSDADATQVENQVEEISSGMTPQLISSLHEPSRFHSSSIPQWLVLRLYVQQR